MGFLDEKTTVKKFLLDFVDRAGNNIQYQIESTEGDLENIMLPFDFVNSTMDDVTMHLFPAYPNKPEKFEDIEFLRYLFAPEEVKDDVEREDRDRYNKIYSQSIILNSLPQINFFVNGEGDIDSVEYSDVTEHDMFGYHPITSSELRSDDKGIWSYHGFRKWEIKNVADVIEATDVDRKVSLFWYQIDGEPIEPIFEEEIRYNKVNNTYVAYIDTNAMGDAIRKNNIESKHPVFKGHFEVHFYSLGKQEAYSYPIEVCVNSTELDNRQNNPILDRNFVSIDFGTSSTCAAIKTKGGAKLFSLSGMEKIKDFGDNYYENPTNLMIYNWNEVYRQWNSDNKNYPFFMARKFGDDESDDIKKADYDSGYTVEDCYKKVDGEDGRRMMEAILTQLKMVPYMLEAGKEIKLKPYHNRDGITINIVDGVPKEEGKRKEFNPIAFYGYILSRAINNPANGQMYKTYNVTFPVKFNKKIVGKIKDSLEYGIKRALPKPLRDAVDRKREPVVKIQMNNSEPVACIGAIAGKQLKIQSGDDSAKLFGIYDLGGGTMDFAFGMFRKSTDDDDTEKTHVIELFEVNGDSTVGGEELIHQIAYKIYKDNKSLMEENRIKFVLPPNELKPSGFDGLLDVKGDEIADANTNTFKENLARHLFKHTGLLDDLTKIPEIANQEASVNVHSYSIRLKSASGEDVDITDLTVDIGDFIKDKIQATVEVFKKNMIDGFSKDLPRRAMRNAGIKFSIDDVYIFLAGNASKQQYVEEYMGKSFPNSPVTRIGASEYERDISDEYRINEKTAVAFGQLYLAGYHVIDEAIRAGESENPPFQFNVGYIDPGTDEFVVVLKKSDSESGWKKANLIDVDNCSTDLYYTSKPDCDVNSLEPLQHDVYDAFDPDSGEETLYIRVINENTIEYRISSRRHMPDDEEEEDREMMIKLADTTIG